MIKLSNKYPLVYDGLGYGKDAVYGDSPSIDDESKVSYPTISGFGNLGGWTTDGDIIGTESNIKRLAAEIADMNYDDFTNGDDYASLAKRYSEQGKKAMDDTIGRVSARTGGLASSYATSAANQAYNGYMEKLEDAARALYDSQRQEKIDNLGISQSIWRDKVGDNQWQQQFDASNLKAEKEEACQKIHNLLAVGTPLDEIDSELIAASGYDVTYWNLYGVAMQATEEEEFTKYIYTGTQDDLGNNVFMYGEGGKTFSFAQGVNPYTGSINPDVKNGTWSNGYQPNNINGEKLSKTGITDVINGVTQNVWQTPDGTKWIWDGTQNKYLKYED